MKVKPKKSSSLIQIILIQIALVIFCNLMYSISFQFLAGYAIVADKLPDNFIQLPRNEQQAIQKNLSSDLIEDLSKADEMQKKYFEIVLEKPIFLFIGSLFWAFFYIYTSYIVFKKVLKIKFVSLEDICFGRLILHGVICGLIIFTAMIVISRVLIEFNFEVKPSIFQQLLIKNLENNKYLFIWSLYSVGLITGIIEEVFFRGFLLKQFQDKNFPIIGLFFTSFIFGFMHYGSGVSILVPVLLSFVGLYFGYLYNSFKNIWVPIAAHVTYNSLILILAYNSGDKFL